MMLKAKLTTFASALILAGATFANEPLCPELDVLQSEGFSMSMEMLGLYAAYQFSEYNTDHKWTFVLAPIEADSGSEALEEANDILSTMTAPGVYDQLDGYPMCSYETGVPGVFAMAVQNSMLTPAKLNMLIQKAH